MPWFADVCALCPLTAETEKLIDADALGRVKPSAYLLNAARGRVVDEPALVDALARRQIRGAALDVMAEEPLAAASPLWAMEHRAHHATYRRRDLPLRGRCARDHAGEPRAALARRDRASEPGGLGACPFVALADSPEKIVRQNWPFRLEFSWKLSYQMQMRNPFSAISQFTTTQTGS